MEIFRMLRRAPKEHEPAVTVSGPPDLDPVPAQLPDPSKPAEARGSWEQAALVNVGITEQVKRELDAQTPPWRK